MKLDVANAIRQLLWHDGGPGALDYDAEMVKDARAKLKAALDEFDLGQARRVPATEAVPDCNCPAGLTAHWTAHSSNCNFAASMRRLHETTKGGVPEPSPHLSSTEEGEK